MGDFFMYLARLRNETSFSYEFLNEKFLKFCLIGFGSIIILFGKGQLRISEISALTHEHGLNKRFNT